MKHLLVVLYDNKQLGSGVRGHEMVFYFSDDILHGVCYYRYDRVACVCFS